MSWILSQSNYRSVAEIKRSAFAIWFCICLIQPSWAELSMFGHCCWPQAQNKAQQESSGVKIYQNQLSTRCATISTVETLFRRLAAQWHPCLLILWLFCAYGAANILLTAPLILTALYSTTSPITGTPLQWSPIRNPWETHQPFMVQEARGTL